MGWHNHSRMQVQPVAIKATKGFPEDPAHIRIGQSPRTISGIQPRVHPSAEKLIIGFPGFVVPRLGVGL